MIKFSQIAYPYTRDEILSIGGTFRPSRAQVGASISDIRLERHLRGKSKYGLVLVDENREKLLGAGLQPGAIAGSILSGARGVK